MIWLSQVSVRSKLALLFITSATSLVVLAAISLWSLHSSTATTRTLVAEDFASVRQLGELRAAIGNMRRFEKDLFLNMSEESDLDKYHAAWRKEVAGGLALASGLEPRLNGSERQSVARMQSGLEAYRKGVESIVANIRIGKVNDPWAANKAMEPFKADVRAADKAFAEILDSVNQRVSGRETELEALEQRTLVRTGVAATLLLAIIAALSWMIERCIVVPLQRAGQAMHRIAHGDLSQTLVPTGRDEIATLGQDIARMQLALSHLVTQLREGIEAVSTASAEIAQGSSDLSTRTETQASSLQQTAASMEQLTGTVTASASHAQAARQLATGASAVAHRGGEVVGQVVKTMDAIQTASRQIADITTVIDGIAFQTNILALNASVEAARAGEQGRGFAVVAGEVRLLAQRSSEAARQIKSLIGASVERVDEGAELVRTAGSTMGDIVTQVQRVHELIDEISVSAREQSSGISLVGHAVANLDESTQQNAALVEQSAAAAESLRQQAETLSQAVGVFRLNAPGAQA